MDSAQLPAPQLGQILIAAGLLTEAQLAQALEEQTRTGRRLGEIIVRRGLVSGPALANALAEQHGGVLKTEYGFATGLGGQVAQKAASEQAPATPTPLLRTADPTPGPQLRVPEPAGDVPPPEPTPPEVVIPRQPVPSPTPTEAAAAEPPLELAPTPPPQPVPPPEALAPPAPEPESAPPPQPAPEPEPEPRPEVAVPTADPELAAAQPDERDALIESLRARIDAQEQELASLRAELEHDRVEREVQVHVWPEEEPAAPAAAPAPAPSQQEHYLVCVPTTSGYVLLDRVGKLPAIGEAVPVPEEEGAFTVTKVVRLPRNGRPCAYLQRP
jgi:hypothetical protein